MPASLCPLHRLNVSPGHCDGLGWTDADFASLMVSKDFFADMWFSRWMRVSVSRADEWQPSSAEATPSQAFIWLDRDGLFLLIILVHLSKGN